LSLLGMRTRVTSWQSSSATRQHTTTTTTTTTTTLVRGERGQWRRVCWRPSWCVRRVLSGGEEGRREKGGDQRSGRGLTRKEETWCSTAGGRRHQTWAQTREKRTAAAGIWQLAAGSWQRGNPPPGLSGALALNAYSYIYKLSCVISRVSRSRLEIPQAGPHYYYYRYRWLAHRDLFVKNFRDACRDGDVNCPVNGRACP
jgi:hypothetical protein